MSNTEFCTDSIKVCHFASVNMKGWTYVRTIFSELKFLGSIDYHIFLPMMLRCALRACESSAIKTEGTQIQLLSDVLAAVRVAES